MAMDRRTSVSLCDKVHYDVIFVIIFEKKKRKRKESKNLKVHCLFGEGDTKGNIIVLSPLIGGITLNVTWLHLI